MKHRLIVVAIIAAVLGSGLAVIMRPLWCPKVYAGVNLAGVNIGGMDKEDVRQLLLQWRQELRGRQITVSYGDAAFRLDAEGIGFDIDVDSTVDDVWNFGRQGWWWDRLNLIRSATDNGYRIPVRVLCREDSLATLFEQWSGEIDRPPRNAEFSILAGGIIPEEEGRRLETEALKPLIFEAFSTPGTTRLTLPVTLLDPEVRAADVSRNGLKEIWAVYKTSFDYSNNNRSFNIRLSARKISGHIVFPGEMFSFNEIVGPRDKEHGFREALEIVDGEFVPGIGGGICQVSSTLYNAVLLSNLTVVERFNHSKPLGYVDLGRDATVAYNALDFKFANNTYSPVMVMAETKGGELVVGIVGQYKLQETVKVLPVEKRTIPPGIVKKPDSRIYLGETEIDKQGKPGYEVTMVRSVFVGGRQIKQEVLSKDHYLPEDTVVRVGTRLPPFAQDKASEEGNENK